MKDSLPTLSWTAEDVMRRWPETIRIFLNFRMLCVGCPIAEFHTLDVACREHHIDAAEFLREILSALAR